jgi:hypothetical protein
MSVNNKLIPSYLFDSYNDIIKCDLILNKNLSDESVMEFQHLLNTSTPKSESDNNYKDIIKYLYRKNPRDFYKLIITSRIKNIILWTESKCIVSHFGLRNIVYIKWDNDENIYKCNIHNNIKNDSNGYNNNLINSIGLSTFLQNNNRYDSGYNNRDNRDNRDNNRTYHRSNQYNDRDQGYNRGQHYYNTNRFGINDNTRHDDSYDVVKTTNKYNGLETDDQCESSSDVKEVITL